MTYCFDTGPLIWFVKRQAAPGQEHRVDEAREFVARVEKQSSRIIIPATVLQEFMVQGDLAHRTAWLAAVEECFEVAAFDAVAASQAAEVEAAFCAAHPNTKRNLRMDIQIVATAVRWQADAVISYDRDIRAIAEGRIPIRGFEEPNTLFVE